MINKMKIKRSILIVIVLTLMLFTAGCTNYENAINDVNDTSAIVISNNLNNTSKKPD